MLPAAGGQSTAQGQSSVLPGWRQGFCSQTGLLSLPPHLLQERYGHRPVVYVGFMAFRGLELQSGGCGAGVGPQSRLLSLLLRCAEELTHRKSSCHRHPRVTAPHSRLLMVRVGPDRLKYKDRNQTSGSCVGVTAQLDRSTPHPQDQPQEDSLCTFSSLSTLFRNLRLLLLSQQQGELMHYRLGFVL